MSMIRQFDVLANPVRAGRADRPFLIVLDHDHFATNGSRIVAALVVESAIKPIPRLNPAFEIDGTTLLLMPNDLFAFPATRLGQAHVNLDRDRQRIIAAIDLVFSGV